MKVGFIGLGHLGLPCAETMARVHDVTGYDRQHRTPSFPMVDKMVDLVDGKDFIFVAVQTSHQPIYDGTHLVHHLPREDFDYTQVQDVLVEIDAVAQPGQPVVLISTVLPGTIRRVLAPSVSNIEIIYNPYFIAMVTVVEDFLKPSLMVYGYDESTAKSLTHISKLIEFYDQCIDEKSTNTSIGTWEEMESIKIFYNTFITWKITFANMIAEVGEKLGHMNPDKVTGVLANETKRIISPMYLKAGGGDAGPCHPRDNIALSWLSQSLDLGYDMFGTLIQAREIQATKLAQRALSYDFPVVLMGKSYKPGTTLTMGSYSLLVGNILESMDKVPLYWDILIECGDNQNIATPTPKTFILMHDGLYNTVALNLIPVGSIVIDLWRTCPPIDDCTVVHFGVSDA